VSPLVDERYLDARRGDLLAAAQRVFVQKGFTAATMHDIAAEAGVSAGSIYRYFESKEDLIRAVTIECEAGYATLFGAPTDGATSPHEILTTAGHEVWRTVSAPEQQDQTILNLESTLVATRNPEVRAALAQAMRSTHALLVRLIARAQQRGELAADVDAGALATFLNAATQGMQTLALQLGDEVDPETVWTVLVQLLDGIRPEEVAR
jgi:AcrR family transcriptional regulator